MLSSDPSVVRLPSEGTTRPARIPKNGHAVNRLSGSRTSLRKTVISKISLLAVLFGLAVTSVFAQAPCAFTTTAANVSETCGNVGIGTANPQNPLHLSQNSVDGLDILFENSSAAGTYPYFHAFLSGSNGWGVPGWPNASVVEGLSNGGLVLSSYAGNLLFQTGTARVSRMTILNSGNIGIGNPNPLFPLDVTGSIHATGNITTSGSITGGTVIGAVYQDVAEWVPATKTMPPGTVVVLNLDRNNEVMPSARAYDTAVAGVVSTHPGVLLGVAAASKAQIATTGRVRVKVDATKQPIKVGDLLVTSDRSGFAMKSIPLDLGGVKIHRPGTLIGKALEPLPRGEGEILVLLSLQ